MTDTNPPADHAFVDDKEPGKPLGPKFVRR